jgi:hypothetical protein
MARDGDHRNRDKLDLRRKNLRIGDDAANLRNQKSRGGSSRYRGVSKDAATVLWVAQIADGKRRLKIGRYGKEEDAARAWDNFPRNGELSALK